MELGPLGAPQRREHCDDGVASPCHERGLLRRARSKVLEQYVEDHEKTLAMRETPRGARVPHLSYPPLRVTRISAPLFDLGIEEHRIEGQSVRVYSVARTVADCFRFRNKVGMDVALEALVQARRSRRLDLDELDRIARPLRVDRVMRPSLEMLVA